MRWKEGSMGRSQTEKGDKVTFRMSDVFLPDAEELRAIWADTAETEGTIVDFSDSGNTSRVFAVVEVLQRQTVVVPVAKLKQISTQM
jgi:hypothetical protein